MHKTSKSNPDSAICAHAEFFDIPGQAVIATATDGRIVYLGAAAAELYGWSEAEAVGRNVIDITPSTLSREQAGEIMSQLAQGKTWTGEFAVRSRDGEEFMAHVRDVPVRDISGRLIGVVGISTRV